MRLLKLVLPVGILLSLGSVLAQAESGATVQTASAPVGTHLTDAEGNALYIFAQDEEGESRCYEACAEAWPPLTVDGEPTAGAGVAESLLGTIERTDGTRQVTYSGRPLYTFAGDAEAGDINGHGMNDAWFLVSPYGSALDVPQAPAESTEGAESGSAGDVPEEVLAHGQEIYSQHCAACHAPDGSGQTGPALTNQNHISDEGLVIRQILRGGSYMPAFADVLSDEEVAAVTTYIRNSFGNAFGLTTPADVEERR